MQGITNPFQDLTERLARIEQTLNEIKVKAVSKVAPEDEFPINIRKAAEITGLSVPTLYTKISRRTIPAHRQAGRIYFFKSELLDWIRSGRRKTVHEIEADAMHSLDRGGEG